MAERLTWQEIQTRYPDQWVGLIEVEWENESTVKSAIVKYSDKSKNELLGMQIKGELYSCYTTPDDFFQLGAVM